MLAQEALPHHVEAAVRQLFKDAGLPAPPIAVAADGSIELGNPLKGYGRIEA